MKFAFLNELRQRGPTIFHVRVILQKRDNSQAASHNMTHEKQIHKT